jgi:hypothetical protein
MSIHFAGSRRPQRSILARCLGAPARMRAANDNGCAIGDNAVLRATLVHFAEHGLGAAAEARARAEQAWLEGDGDGYRHWLGVCRTLDRRMADRAARRPAGF